MSAPYRVLIDDFGDHRYLDCQTLDEAIKKALKVPTHGWRHVAVFGDGAEGGYGDDGTQFHDGLTDDERELVEEAGL